MYYDVLVKTFINKGERSASKIRVFPLSGQGLEAECRVECSQSMRHSHPVGTIFKIEAKLKMYSSGVYGLYSHFDRPYEVLSEEQAAVYLAQKKPYEWPDF